MLPEAYSGNVERGFMMVTEKLLQQGVKVLAHPFRFFRRHGMETPRHLFRPMAKLLAAYGVAAELNFHTNEPDPEFFRLLRRVYPSPWGATPTPSTKWASLPRT